MKPTTENPRMCNKKHVCGQRKSVSTKIVSFIMIINIMMFSFVFPLSDGEMAAKSTTRNMSILSNEDNIIQLSSIGASDISIALTDSNESVATENATGEFKLPKFESCQFETLNTSNVVTDSAFQISVIKNQNDTGPTDFRENFMRTSIDDVSSSAITVEPAQEDSIQPNNIILNEETNLIHHEEHIKNDKKSEKVYAYDKIRYVKASSGLNVRRKPNTNSKVLKTISFGKKVKVSMYDKKWAVIKYKTKKGEIKPAYISRKYISSKKPQFKSKSVSGDRRKSFMDWKCITSRTSPQYKLQQIASTASNGVRTVNGRYCIALGSYYTSEIGKVVDLVLKNGTVIPCVIGDQKDDSDTNSTNAIGNDGSVGEFIVTTGSLSHKTLQSGDCSDASPGWNSPINEVRLYNKNLLKD